MGGMSCTSVTGMELKERLFRMRRQMLLSLGRNNRPTPTVVK